MKMRIIFIVASLLLGTSCSSEAKPRGQVEAATTDELAERNAIFERVRVAVERKDFAGLNAMATEFRTKRSRTPSGIWKLSAFYAGFQAFFPHPLRRGCVDELQPFVSDWIKADPRQPAPYIVQAMAHLSLGTCIRGDDLASKVPAEAMAELHRNVAAARNVLESHRDVASVDPQFYATMVKIYNYDGTGDWAMQSLLEEAADREPYYYETYFSASQYYLPQWHGDGNDVDWLGNFASDYTEEGDGKGAYARVIWGLEQYDERALSMADWSTMKESMQDIMRAYPNDWNAANFARYACRKNDKETAASYFAQLSYDSGVAWADKGEWRACRAFAGTGSS